LSTVRPPCFISAGRGTCSARRARP
jgi:hypothetical protein